MSAVRATAEFHQLLCHQPSLVWYDAISASAAARVRVGAGRTQAVQLPSWWDASRPQARTAPP
jgi:hypothetical protein